MLNLWNKNNEKEFFITSMQRYASPEQLFYITKDKKHLAYWPKKYEGKKTVLQSRNSLIGKFTEKWTADLVREAVKDKGLFTVQDAVCEEIALLKSSPADVLISKTDKARPKPEDILMIIEVKMSIVWNWQLTAKDNLECKGDYKTHQGNPGLLRSDTMLKAIGKSINIRVSSNKASGIPIIVMGNTPIKNSYYAKVDHLKVAGIVQGFWSLNPFPLDEENKENIKSTEKKGFCRIDTFSELKESINGILGEKRDFFSSMKSSKELGLIIAEADKEDTYEKKAEVFLKLIRE